MNRIETILRRYFEQNSLDKETQKIIDNYSKFDYHYFLCKQVENKSLLPEIDNKFVFYIGDTKTNPIYTLIVVLDQETEDMIIEECSLTKIDDIEFYED